jgi:hypothetical protein
MAENKTMATNVSVGAFLAAVESAERREDAARLVAMMSRVTGEEPKMWGPGIVGFGSCHYRYESGREGDMCLVGFSPRKAEFSIYLMGQYGGSGTERDALLARLGKHRMGKGCLYVKRLEQIDVRVLEELVTLSVAGLRRLYG